MLCDFLLLNILLSFPARMSLVIFDILERFNVGMLYKDNFKRQSCLIARQVVCGF